MKSIEKLSIIGQSIWYDNIERRLLKNGEIRRMIERGEIRGVTSNPSIFNNAIANSKDYDDTLIPLAKGGFSNEEIYESMAVDDIQAACELFNPLYESTSGGDGYVSLEVSPNLAYDSVGTTAEAARLWSRVDRPNLMIKIPGTEEGLQAIKNSISAGINVNVTLIFSVQRYRKVIDAFLAGLEERLSNDQSVEGVASVASFFISRIDSNVDMILDQFDDEKSENLKGKIAVANAKLAYRTYKQLFNGKRWDRLAEAGVRVQRPLWASTSTKNPAYSDTKYVDELIGPNTVNTIPPATLIAFLDHGTMAPTLESDLDSAQAAMENLTSLGISIDEVTQNLEKQGVKSFQTAFASLLVSIDERRRMVS